MRRWPTVAGLVWLFALTQASAEEALSPPQDAVQQHRAKVKIVRPVSPKAAGHAVVSGPYASLIGAGKAKGSEFFLPERTIPVEPQGGFSLTAGRSSPDAPMRGGLMFRF